MPAHLQRAPRALTATLAASLLLAAVLLLTAGVPSAAAETCPNAARREEQGAAGRALPDCRAYELVTPPDSAPPVAPIYLTSLPAESLPSYPLPEGNEQVQAATDGGGIAYGSEDASHGSPGLVDLATRGPAGWSTQNAIPPQSVMTGICMNADVIAAWSADLSRGVLIDGNDVGFLGTEEECGRDEPELVPGEPQGKFGNLFQWDSLTGNYQLVNVTPPTVEPAIPLFDAASEDLTHVVFDESAQLTDNAPAGDQLYQWSAGRVYLVTILPGGTPVQGRLAGAVANPATLSNPPWQTGDFTHAVSADGSRIFFQAGGNLYLRQNGAQEPPAECLPADPASACTVQVDESQGGASPGGGGLFRWASADGSRVFFTDDRPLTPGSFAEPGKPDLYEYEADTTGAQGTLTDLTPSPLNPGEAADVLGVSGASRDGSSVYFVADGVLAPGANSHGDTAQPGRPNLYLSRAGTTHFIATLRPNSSDECDWISVCLTARVSANGAFIAFDSVAPLTGYDNTPAAPSDCEWSLGHPFQPGAPCIEVFRYAAPTDQLACASCGPAGALPTASATIRTPARTNFWRAANLYLANNVSDTGQVFFDTSNRLLPAAANGLSNVYEYQDDGLHLLSSGTSDAGAYFFDASPSGGDAFLATEQRLVPRDTGTSLAIYDARVGGGFPEPPPPAPCEAESCRGGGTAGAATSPGTAAFEGPGNPPPLHCKKPRVKRHGRCVKPRRNHRGKHRHAHHKHGGHK